uniref:Uncharacterized protein n=1 Tax=Aegilops tauschii subsp. strangulata TaxID=200361 RepID=A0A453AYY1_AEGTS
GAATAAPCTLVEAGTCILVVNGCTSPLIPLDVCAPSPNT